MHTFGTKLAQFYANEPHCKNSQIHKHSADSQTQLANNVFKLWCR